MKYERHNSFIGEEVREEIRDEPFHSIPSLESSKPSARLVTHVQATFRAHPISGTLGAKLP